MGKERERGGYKKSTEENVKGRRDEEREKYGDRRK